MQLFFAFLLGLALCRVYERTGRLRYAMLLHFLNNLLMVLPVFFRWEMSAVSTVECVVGALFLGAAILWAVLSKKQGENLLPAGIRDALKDWVAFVTALPMLLLTLLCVGVCFWVMFI
jgi:membrane protease YdiL (CAAX protease family)